MKACHGALQAGYWVLYLVSRELQQGRGSKYMAFTLDARMPLCQHEPETKVRGEGNRGRVNWTEA
jgi:hypothetical protein